MRPYYSKRGACLREDGTKPQLEIIILAEFPVGPQRGLGLEAAGTYVLTEAAFVYTTNTKAGLSAARRILAPGRATSTFVPGMANQLGPCVGAAGGQTRQGSHGPRGRFQAETGRGQRRKPK